MRAHRVWYDGRCTQGAPFLAHDSSKSKDSVWTSGPEIFNCPALSFRHVVLCAVSRAEYAVLGDGTSHFVMEVIFGLGTGNNCILFTGCRFPIKPTPQHLNICIR